MSYDDRRDSEMFPLPARTDRDQPDVSARPYCEQCEDLKVHGFGECWCLKTKKSARV